MSDQKPSPDAPAYEPGSIEEFLDKQAPLVSRLKGEHGDRLAVVRSPWGPIIVAKKPSYQQDLAFNAALRHPNPVKQCEGSYALLQNVIVWPDMGTFRQLREEYGFQFVDDLAARVMGCWGPKNPGAEKNL